MYKTNLIIYEIDKEQIMNIALWILQVLLAGVFIMAGGFKLLTPAEEMLAMGMTVPTLVLRIAGITELLGALGLILPSVLRIQPHLTPIAASLLALQVGLAASRASCNGRSGCNRSASFPFSIMRDSRLRSL